MCFIAIATNYNGPLEAAHEHIDDDRDDMVQCGAAGQLKVNLSYKLRRCTIALLLRKLSD